MICWWVRPFHSPRVGFHALLTQSVMLVESHMTADVALKPFASRTSLLLVNRAWLCAIIEFILIHKFSSFGLVFSPRSVPEQER